MSKEFGIIAGSSEKLSMKTPMLVAGDIDVLYKIAVKTCEFNESYPTEFSSSMSIHSPLKLSSSLNRDNKSAKNAGSTNTTATANSKSSYHKVFLATGSVKKVFKSSTSSLMSLQQFTVVMKHFALKLYANIIEQQLGTAFDFLPAVKKEQATQMAIEMFIKEKV